MTLLQKPWCNVRNVLLSQFLSTSMNLHYGWGHVTVEKSPWQSALLCLFWSSNSLLKALRFIWAHYPAAVSLLLRKDAKQRMYLVSANVSLSATSDLTWCSRIFAGIHLQSSKTPQSRKYTALFFSVVCLLTHAPVLLPKISKQNLWLKRTSKCLKIILWAEIDSFLLIVHVLTRFLCSLIKILWQDYFSALGVMPSSS